MAGCPLMLWFWFRLTKEVPRCPWNFRLRLTPIDRPYRISNLSYEMFTVLTKRSLIEYDNFKLEMTLAFLGALAFLGCLDLGLINYPTGKLIYIHNSQSTCSKTYKCILAPRTNKNLLPDRITAKLIKIEKIFCLNLQKFES